MLIYLELKGKWNKAKSNYDFPSGQTKLLYKGRVAKAFGGGGGGQAPPPVATGPWQPQVPYVNELFSRAYELLQQQPPQYPTGQLTPGQNPLLSGSYGMTEGMVPQNVGAINAAQQSVLQNATAPNALAQTGQGLAPSVQGGISSLINSPNAVQQAGQATMPGVVGAINQATTGGSPTGPTFGDVNAFPAINNALYSNGMNPFTAQIVDAALRSSNEQFQTNVLPGIRTGAGQSNQVGGTRQGIAEGIASRALLNQQGDVISRLYGQAFDVGSSDRNAALQLVAQGQGLNEASRSARTGEALRGAELGGNLLTSGTDLRQQALSTGTAQGGQLLQAGQGSAMDQYFRSLGMLPQLQATQLANLGFQNQAGLQQYGIQQQGIDAEMDRYFYNMLAPYNALTQFQNFIAGPWGSSLPGSSNWQAGMFPPGSPYAPTRPGPGVPGAPPGPIYNPQPGVTPAPGQQPIYTPQPPYGVPRDTYPPGSPYNPGGR